MIYFIFILLFVVQSFVYSVDANFFRTTQRSVVQEKVVPSNMIRLSYTILEENKKGYSYYDDRIRLYLEYVKKQFGSLYNKEAKAEALLRFLHNKIFLFYKEDESSLLKTLEQGVFNCVSSSILYGYFAYHLDLEPIFIKTESHVFIKIQLNGSLLDIETTSPEGFNPEQHYLTLGKERIDLRDNKNLQSVITLQELLGILYHNQAYSAFNKKTFSKALEFSYKRYLFENKGASSFKLFSTISYYYLENLRLNNNYKEFLNSLFVFKEWGLYHSRLEQSLNFFLELYIYHLTTEKEFMDSANFIDNLYNNKFLHLETYTNISQKLLTYFKEKNYKKG